MAIEPDGDYFVPVVPIDHIEHPEENPFCYDATCDCYEDDEVIEAVYQAVLDGLLTADEATDLVLGRLL